jgi:PAS domain S-box-containing protein
MALIDHVSVGGWQDLFTSIIEDADSNLLLLDDEFKIISLNPGFYWIFLETYGVELKKGESLIDTLEGVDAELTSNWQKRCVMALAGSAIKVEETFEFDGRTYFWEIHFKASKGPVSSPIISVFSRDITIRKAYQKKILQNEANVRSILNTIDDSIWLVNSSYQLIDFNKAFYKKYKLAFGVKLMKGENILDFVPKELNGMKEEWEQRYANGLKGRPGKYIDSFPIGNDHRMYEIRTFPIVENGNVCGLTLYARDITSQLKAENLLKQQNEELSKINAELDRFVYSASHDLRAPLMSIKGLLNMIKVDPEEKNRGNYLELIEKSVSKLDHFILDIINYSRNSRMQVIAKEIDFQELLNESIESLKYMEGAEMVACETTIHSPCPFYSDYSRLLIIFNNIVSNAVRYRDPWKSNSHLKISIATDEEKAVIRFEDNGVGIADEYLNNVFKMFFRANADSKGSGLGLYIVKGVVEKMNGTIDVASKLGEGTVFTIQIPNLIRCD